MTDAEKQAILETLDNERWLRKLLDCRNLYADMVGMLKSVQCDVRVTRRAEANDPLAIAACLNLAAGTEGWLGE